MSLLIDATAELDRMAKVLEGTLQGEVCTFAGKVLRERCDMATRIADLEKCLGIAEQALFELRGSHECRGDHYDGWASDALRKIDALKKGSA